MLGSLKCDCADQLSLAFETFQADPPGLVIYLQQEVRTCRHCFRLLHRLCLRVEVRRTRLQRHFKAKRLQQRFRPVQMNVC